MSANKLPVYFAPLQGYTDHLYRNVHQEVFGGVTAYYSPFVRLEKGAFRNKDLRDVLPDNNHVARLIPQLIAAKPDEMERIVDLFAERGYREVDINMGCPFPLIARKHKGSGILPFTNEAEELLKVTAHYPDISFSVKMRLGWELPEECLALLPLLNELPLAHIAMHPRIGKQQYKGSVDMDGFTAFYEGCKHNLIYNGDVCTIEDMVQLEKQFPKLKGIMIGRGLLANPALALEYANNSLLSEQEKREKLRSLHERLLAGYSQMLEGGEMQIVTRLKSFWEYLLPDSAKKQKKKILKSNSLSAYTAAVRDVLG